MGTKITLFIFVAAFIITIKKLLLESDGTILSDFKTFKRVINKRRNGTDSAAETKNETEAENTFTYEDEKHFDSSEE